MSVSYPVKLQKLRDKFRECEICAKAPETS